MKVGVAHIHRPGFLFFIEVSSHIPQQQSAEFMVSGTINSFSRFNPILWIRLIWSGNTKIVFEDKIYFVKNSEEESFLKKLGK